jgi:hypothetical protein
VETGDIYIVDGFQFFTVGKKGGFEYRVKCEAILRHLIRYKRQPTFEEIYQIAKIESQYIEYEEVNNIPDPDLCNPSGIAKL